jgi:glutamyl-tRNA reductase
MADLIIGCAASSDTIVGAQLVERVMRDRKQKAMFFIDIGDRRNFDAAINDLDNVYLYNIDDLKSVADDHVHERASEAAKAERIVQEEVTVFVRWMDSLEQVPTINALREKFETIRLRELEKSFGGALKNLSAEQRAALEELTLAMMNKVLHGPISQLKKNSSDESTDGTLYMAALKRLFELDDK